jgi:hypothetical protein
LDANDNELNFIDSDGKAIGPNTTTDNDLYKNINGMLGTQSKAGFFYYPVQGLPKDVAFAGAMLGQYPTGFHLVNWNFVHMFFFEFVLVALLIASAICFLWIFFDVKYVTKQVSYDKTAFHVMSTCGYIFCIVALLLCTMIWFGNIYKIFSTPII